MTTNYLLTVKAVESCDVPIKITVCSSSDKEKIENFVNLLNAKELNERHLKDVVEDFLVFNDFHF